MNGYEAEPEPDRVDRDSRRALSDDRRPSTASSRHRFEQLGPRLPCGRCFDVLDPLDADALYDGFVVCSTCNRPYHRRCYTGGCRRPGCRGTDSRPVEVAPPIDSTDPIAQPVDSIGPCNRLSDRPIGLSRGLVFLHGTEAVDLVVANNSTNAVGLAPQLFPPWVDVQIDCVRTRLPRRLSRVLFRDVGVPYAPEQPRPGDIELAPGAQIRFTLSLRVLVPRMVEAFVPIGPAQGVLIVGQGYRRLWTAALVVLFSSSVVVAKLTADVVSDGAADTSLIALGSSFAFFGTALILMPTALSSVLRSLVVGGYATTGERLPSMPTVQTAIVAALTFFALGIAIGLFFHILNDVSGGERSGFLFRLTAWSVATILCVGYTTVEIYPYRETIELESLRRFIGTARRLLRSRRK